MTEKMAPIHPGEFLLEDFIKPLGLNAHRLAQDLRVPANRITAIIKGTRAISPDTAARLGRYFGTGAEYWLKLQVMYELEALEDEALARIEAEVPVLRRA